MKHILTLVFLFGFTSCSRGQIRFSETETSTQTKQVITGPKGTKTITSKGKSTDREVPFVETNDSVSDVEVQGEMNPGITVERHDYPYGKTGPVGSLPDVKGGPGSIHTESSTKKKRLPPVQVKIR